MPKPMNARYPGKCRKCGERFPAGTRIYFAGKGNASHVVCPGRSEDENGPESRTILPVKQGAFDSHISEWFDLKKIMLAACDGKFDSVPNHETQMEKCVSGGSWEGYLASDVQRWLKSGYKSSAVSGLGDFTPPLREKRRMKYTDEGDEFHYDLAASGDENFMSEWTKKEVIPGAKVEISVGMSCAVSAATVNAYNAWTCQAIKALEDVGIDTQISLILRADGMLPSHKASETRIRVKKENEALDFNSFSAALGPMQLRTVMFTAMFRHCEARDGVIVPGYGRCSNYNKTFGVRWDEKSRRLYIECDYNGYGFSGEKMSHDLRKAVHQMAGKSG